MLEELAGRITVDAEEARVQPANGAPPVAQQLLGEAMDFDAQVAALNVILGKAGVAGQLPDDLGALFRRQRGAS